MSEAKPAAAQNKALQNGGGSSIGLGGSLAVIVGWLLGEAGVVVPADAAAALTAVFSWGLTYLLSDS